MFYYLLRQSTDGRSWLPFYVTQSETAARRTLEQELATRIQTNFPISTLEIAKDGAFSGRLITARPANRSPRVVAFLVPSNANPFELAPLEEKCPHQECPVSICLHYSKFLKYQTSTGNVEEKRYEFSAAVHSVLSKLKNRYGR